MQLRSQFDQRSNQAGSQMRVLAEALRRSGSDLSSQGKTSAARLAAQTADPIERVGTYLEQRSGDDLVRDIETFARRRPWILAGVGMFAGLAAARFMKASSEQRYGDHRRTNDQQWPTRKGTGGAAAYGELERGGYEADTPTVGFDVQSISSDDSRSRDPYAGAR
jgi:hypothetical protein